MKTNIMFTYVLAALLSAASFSSNHAAGASYVVGISPNYDTSQRTVVLQSLLVFILETATPGDSITICDALNQRLVTTLTIPEGKLFQANARARAQRLAAPMAALKQFIMADRSYPPAMANVIAMPQFLDFVATQLRRPGESLRVVVLASPLYVDVSGNGACTMLSAFPSDANLTATPDQSVFGCALKKTILSGVTVHLAYLNTPFLNEYHQERVSRFWVLYCQQTSGCLSSWCADPILAFRRAKENVQQPCIEAQLDLADRTIELRQVSRRSVVEFRAVTNDLGRVSVTSDVPRVSGVTIQPVTNTAQVTPAPTGQVVNQPVTPSPAIATLQPAAGNASAAFEPARLADAFPVQPAANAFGVGIAWSASVDVDIYVQPQPGSEELSFHNTVTPEGRYLHDWRNGNLGLDYEYVRFNADQAVDLSRIGCWINYYSGRVSPVRGIVVVHYEGQAFRGEFSLAAPGGNKAGDKDKRQHSRYWVRLDLASIVRSGQMFQSANSSR